MGEANLNFILSLGLVVCAIGFTVRVIHARLRLDRYKKNSKMYELYSKATSTPRIVISAIIAIVLAANFVLQFRNTAKVVDDSTLTFDAILTVGILIISFGVAYFLSKYIKPEQK